MSTSFYNDIQLELDRIDSEGLYTRERLITSKQAADIVVSENGQTREVINFCANNYLGLADHPDLIKASERAAKDHGFGMASVRFICGTQGQHRELEQKIADWLGYDDAILYAACFDANGGVFQMRSIMPQSLMVSACARPNATALKPVIWPTLRFSLSRRVRMAPVIL